MTKNEEWYNIGKDLGLRLGRKEGARQEIKFFLKCLKEDYAFKSKVVMSKDKLNYIWSLIQVNEERLKELE